MRTIQLSNRTYDMVGVALNSVLMHYAAKHGQITQQELIEMRATSLKLLERRLGNKDEFMKLMSEVVLNFPPPGIHE